MKSTANAVLLVVLVFVLWQAPPTQPPKPQPPLIPVGGLGAIVVDVSDEQLAAFAGFIQNRGATLGGWSISVDDNFLCRVDGNVVSVGGGVRVAGRVAGVPITTTINTLTVSPDKVTIDLNKIPFDIVLR